MQRSLSNVAPSRCRSSLNQCFFQEIRVLMCSWSVRCVFFLNKLFSKSPQKCFNTCLHTQQHNTKPHLLFLWTQRVKVGERAAELHVEKPRGQSVSHLSPDLGSGARSSPRFIQMSLGGRKYIYLVACWAESNKMKLRGRKMSIDPFYIILECQPVIRYFIKVVDTNVFWIPCTLVIH